MPNWNRPGHGEHCRCEECMSWLEVALDEEAQDNPMPAGLGRLDEIDEAEHERDGSKC